MVLDSLGSSLQSALEKVAGKTRIDEEAVDEVVKDIQRALLQADVDVDLVMEMSDSIRDRALNEEPPKGTSPREHVLHIVYDEMVDIVGDTTDIELDDQVILLSGLQGSGKTTSAAKIAKWFSRKGMKTGLVQTDTFRPGAYTQAKEMSEKAEVPFYGEQDNEDPVEIAENGLREFSNREVVIVDTAGRHALENDLIDEIEAIEDAVDPDMNLLVLDASLGQGAKDQAQAFDSSIGIGGVVITKLDGTAKGGGALSAVNQTDSSIAYIGVGEGVSDLERFDPDGFISRLLGMGDIKALVDRVEEAMEESEMDPEMEAEEIFQGNFTLKDVYKQMEAMSNMGPIDQVLDMIPGIGGMGGIKDEMPDNFADVTSEKMSNFRAIMDSMTEEELEDPNVIGAKRIERIARGSGKTEQQVRELLEYYETMQSTIKQMRGGGGRDMQRMMKKMEGGDMDMGDMGDFPGM
ncbi:MAG: signal recognition particle protein Srp54 [Halobacteria archaeon]